ncbi:MAG: glycosyltransferase family 4 protein [Gaiellaceae bacterium]
MRIVVDVTPLFNPLTGIGNYWVGMLGGLAEAAGDEHEVVAFAITGPRRRRPIVRALDGIEVRRRLLVVPPSAQTWRRLWSRAGRPPVEWLAGRLDVFHRSDWMTPAQRHGIRATTIHDLGPLHHPELVAPLTRRMHVTSARDAATACDVVFCNARFTARDVHETLGVPEERLRVAYPGIHPRFRDEGERRDLGAPYVLAVGTDEPRKNLARLQEAHRLLRARGSELGLVLAGGAGWLAEHRAGDGVHALGYVRDDALPPLYRGASVYCYPSLFEGFGMPVLEAMACGTPVVASSHPSLDEACGDVAVRTDPSDPEAIADSIERALALPGETIERGFEHAARFTWRACGEAVLASYRSVS